METGNEFDQFLKYNKCPFCGCRNVEALERPSYITNGDYWVVECPDCWAVGPAAHTERLAVLLWNGLRNG